MNGARDIAWIPFLWGYLLLLLPLFTLAYYRTGLVKSTCIAVVRMSVQLLLVGLYLEFIFKLNNGWINLLWILVMVVLTSLSIINRSRLTFKFFVGPVFWALGLSLIGVLTYFFLLVLRLAHYYEARYLLPITGMLLGNCMQSNIIGLNAYYSRLRQEQQLYRYALASGATRREALYPFMRDALVKAFNPAIASMAVLGLVSLPGMMTGQILGGSLPSVAIKYQIMIMMAILVCSLLSLILTIFLANRYAFDAFDNFRLPAVKPH
jgi:putative ABC transport system permease protein